jgi:hypothetical protein
VARTPDLELHALWRERIGRQAHSGLTIARFCAREHLSLTTFQSWKRRLRLIDLADRHPSPAAPPAFLPVTVRVPQDTPSEPLVIEADFPNGVRLRIPTTDTRLACRIVHAVARARTDAGAAQC